MSTQEFGRTSFFYLLSPVSQVTARERMEWGPWSQCSCNGELM